MGRTLDVDLQHQPRVPRALAPGAHIIRRALDVTEGVQVGYARGAEQRSEGDDVAEARLDPRDRQAVALRVVVARLDLVAVRVEDAPRDQVLRGPAEREPERRGHLSLLSREAVRR